ncbi:hypothetical protein [Nostoc sp.]|uniref:hypothetical protein n=1 Tax=Nostoc sp. TaxID=1180 RepID=UPI002FF5AA7A
MILFCEKPDAISSPCSTTEQQLAVRLSSLKALLLRRGLDNAGRFYTLANLKSWRDYWCG